MWLRSQRKIEKECCLNQEFDLAGIVELLQTNSILSVDGLLLHRGCLIEVSNGEVAAKANKRRKQCIEANINKV
jgi:hypothetical protein